MKKTTNSNPLKIFNDAFDKRKAGLKKAQVGQQTAFQNYAKQYPNSASDTLSSNAPVFDANAVQARALAGAMKKTYGNNPVPSANPKSYTTAKGYFDKEGQQEAAAIQKSARIPQQKDGGPKASDSGKTNPNTGGFDKKKDGATKSKKK